MILLKEINRNNNSLDKSQEIIPKVAKVEENLINLSNENKIEKNEKKSRCC